MLQGQTSAYDNIISCAYDKYTKDQPGGEMGWMIARAAAVEFDRASGLCRVTSDVGEPNRCHTAKRCLCVIRSTEKANILYTSLRLKRSQFVPHYIIIIIIIWTRKI